MTPTETRPYEAAAYLNTVEDCALYLQAVIEEADGDPAILSAALEDISQARRMARAPDENQGSPVFPTANRVLRR